MPQHILPFFLPGEHGAKQDLVVPMKPMIIVFVVKYFLRHPRCNLAFFKRQFTDHAVHGLFLHPNLYILFISILNWICRNS